MSAQIENQVEMKIVNVYSTQMDKLMTASIYAAVKACSERYDFPLAEAMSLLGSGEKEVVQIPMPYLGTMKESCCYGVVVNHGLYTQCPKGKKSGDLCAGCQKQSTKNTSGKPDNGLITERDVENWKSPSGKAPTAYQKVMKKLKLTETEVIEAARKYEIELPSNLFEQEVKRGRPKGPEKEIELIETENLFQLMVSSQLVDNALEVKEEEKEVVKEEVKEKAVKIVKKKKEPTEEELAEKAAKEEAKAAKEAEKLAKEAALKEAKEAEKIAKEEKKKAKEAEKAIKEAAKLEKKASPKSSPKSSKKELKGMTDEEAAAKGLPIVEDNGRSLSSSTVKIDEELEEEDEEEVSVHKQTIKGVEYLVDENGVVYDMKSQDPIGEYRPASDSIELYE
jgi:hypothetical protein